MNNEKFQTLLNEKIVDKLCYSLLYSLACGHVTKTGKSGESNLDAFNILFNSNCNGVITIEEIQQEMYLYLIEYSDYWNIFETIKKDNKYNELKIVNSLEFTNEEIGKNFYKIPSKMLYQNIRKHDRKKLWIEIDGELIKIDDIQNLASHTCIDDVITLSLYQQFYNYLYSVKPKRAERYINSINARLQGLKYAEISKSLEIKETSVKKDFQELKKLWKEFDK